MIIPEKNQPEFVACLLTATLVFAVLARYGKHVIEWILMKLYELFIQKNPVNK